MSIKRIKTNLKWIATTAAKVNEHVHETALLICEHAQAHGDCDYAKSLFNAMPASMRRSMLKLWFETYSPIRFVLDSKTGLASKVGMLKDNAKTYVPFNLEDGGENPFYSLAEANPEGKALDFDKIVALVTALGKRIEKSVAEGKVVEADVESATAAARAIGAMRFERVVAVSDPNTLTLVSNNDDSNPLAARTGTEG